MKNGHDYAAQADPARNRHFSRTWGDDPLGLRFRRQVEHVHGLGARATAELLAEIGAERSIMTLIGQKLGTYLEIKPEALEAAGGDEFSPVPIHEVQS